MHSWLGQVILFSYFPVHSSDHTQGTGGTVAGTGQYLKSMNEDIYIAIADPDGSGLFNKVISVFSFHSIHLTSRRQVKHGVMYDGKESEGTKRRHQVDTVVEGMYACITFPVGCTFNISPRGINRMTRNIALALPRINDAFRCVDNSLYFCLSIAVLRVTDAEAVAMSRYLVKNDGFFLGSSSACNLMACVKLVKQMGWTHGKTIVTIL